MARPALSLSLQFARFDGAELHRAALPRHRVARWIRQALEGDAEIAVRIVGADEGQRLNREFRGKDYATNVLTFDYGEDEADPTALPPGAGDATGATAPAAQPPQPQPQPQPPIMADLVLCAPVVAREAAEQGKTLADHYAHLLVHGALHAQGWDHETGEADAEAMEARERDILARLGVPDPY